MYFWMVSIQWSTLHLIFPGKQIKYNLSHKFSKDFCEVSVDVRIPSHHFSHIWLHSMRLVFPQVSKKRTALLHLHQTGRCGHSLTSAPTSRAAQFSVNLYQHSGFSSNGTWLTQPTRWLSRHQISLPSPSAVSCVFICLSHRVLPPRLSGAGKQNLNL